MTSYNYFGCSWCGGPFNGENCPGCSSVGSGNEFVYDLNPYSYNDTLNFFNQPPRHQYKTYSCELCEDSPDYGFDCQTRTPLVYEQDPCNNQNFSNDQSPYYSPRVLNLRNSNQDPPVELYHLEGSDNEDNKIDSLTKKHLDTLLMKDEVISTTPESENNEFIKSSVDDLVPIPKDSEKVDIDLPFGEHLDTLLTGDREFDFNPSKDIEELERLLADDPVPVPVPRVFDEPLSNSDLVPRSYDVTFSNPLFDFNDDYTLCYDNPLFDEEFEDISSLYPPSRLQLLMSLPC
nr:hypothetical protein [Tanacetum cinerariifolium]